MMAEDIVNEIREFWTHFNHSGKPPKLYEVQTFASRMLALGNTVAFANVLRSLYRPKDGPPAGRPKK